MSDDITPAAATIPEGMVLVPREQIRDWYTQVFVMFVEATPKGDDEEDDRRTPKCMVEMEAALNSPIPPATIPGGDREAILRRLSMARAQLTAALNLRGSGVPAGRWGWATDHGVWLLRLAEEVLTSTGEASVEVLADAGGAQQLPVPPPYWCEGMGKYGMSLSFEGGVLLINIAGYDDRDGHGQIAFKPDDAKKDDEGYLCVGLPNSELIAIRDQLNKWFPPEIESVLRPADGTELPHKDGWRILRSVDPDGPNPQLLWERVPLSANPVTVDAGGVGELVRSAFMEALWAGSNSGRAGEEMDAAYAAKSWEVSDAAKAIAHTAPVAGEPAHENDAPEARLDMVRVVLEAIAGGEEPKALAKAGLDFCNLTQAEREAMRGEDAALSTPESPAAGKVVGR